MVKGNSNGHGDGFRISLSGEVSPLEIPELIDIQKASYERFLQSDLPPDKREDVGMQAAFKNLIIEVPRKARLEFDYYKLADQKYTPDECKMKGLTYAKTMRVAMKLTVLNEKNEPIEIKKEEVFFGEVPLMTERGTFILNGAERVVVSQLYKSPGVYFEIDKEKAGLKRLSYIARIVPYEGTWLTISFDMRDLMGIVVDKKRKKKVNIVLFLKSLGLTDSEILSGIGVTGKIKIVQGKVYESVSSQTLQRAWSDIKNSKGEVIMREGEKFTLSNIRKLKEAGIDWIEADEDRIVFDEKRMAKRVLAEDIRFGLRLKREEKKSEAKVGDFIFADDITYDGEKILCREPKKQERADFKVILNIVEDGVILKAGSYLTKGVVDLLKRTKEGVEIQTVWYDDLNVSGSIVKTLRDCLFKQRVRTEQDACTELFRKIRPGEPVNQQMVRSVIHHLFLANERLKFERRITFFPGALNWYAIGRVKTNSRLNLENKMKIKFENRTFFKEVKPEILKFQFASRDVKDSSGKVILKQGEKFSEEVLEKLRGSGWVEISVGEMFDMVAVEDILVDGEVLLRAGEYFDETVVDRLTKKNKSVEFRVSWEPLSVTLQDFFYTVKYLYELKCKMPGRYVDDIDNLSNRRVRTVGELASAHFKNALLRIVRPVYEKLKQGDPETMTPKQIINFKPVATLFKEFFTLSQFSQFLDQVNPLAELTHKRRLSSLGPGGLSRRTAGFEVRDVHTSHYGKICPIETPEGQNIGLITSLAIYSSISDLGFLQTPYRKVENGVIKDDVVYLTALEEEKNPIAPYGTPVRSVNGYKEFAEDKVTVRLGEDIRRVSSKEVKYIDVSPFQILGVSAGLIPFLEHDDSNRALMGANMQRQAVPLMVTEPPLVGTGIERDVAVKSGFVVLAHHSGYVEYVDAERVLIRVKDDDFPMLEGTADIYNLKKYVRSNQSTCINYIPCVSEGEYVRRGDVIADGPCTSKGELALGRNVLVAIMPWRGYNFEDSIVVSERLVFDDVFTSVHIENLVCDVKRTKLGNEEITRDIPGVAIEKLSNLDEFGIIKVGSEVKPGDILVGKVTPRGEVYLAPEERLVRAVFGRGPENEEDSSLRCPPDVRGVVIAVYIHTRRGYEKDERAKRQDEEELERLERDKKDRIEGLRDKAVAKIYSKLISKELESDLKLQKRVFHKGRKIDDEIFAAIRRRLLEYEKVKSMKNFISGELHVEQGVKKEVLQILTELEKQEEEAEAFYRAKRKDIEEGDELPTSVLKRVRVVIASKRKISVGDKLSGRHGNKGVISIVLPREDMPFLPDGTPVDIVLSPLGIPSRMNVGQAPVFEALLGWVSKELGRKIGKIVQGVSNGFAKKIKSNIKNLLNGDKIKSSAVRNIIDYFEKMPDEELLNFLKDISMLEGVKFASPPFAGLDEDSIKEMVRELPLDFVNLSSNPFDKTDDSRYSMISLRDGRTGEFFGKPIAVGYMYIMKLVHMVEDKIHVRSTGNYSLITQQPLGGKSRGGGQRFGEMEVWALESYGAAYTLQEMLTIKSDDIQGRKRIVESISKEGKPLLQPTMPESFNVIVKELQALCIDVTPLTEVEAEEMQGDKGGEVEKEEKLKPRWKLGKKIRKRRGG